MLLRACSNYSASVSSKDVFVSLPSRGRKSPCYTVLPPVFDILRKHSIPTLRVSLVQQIRLPILYDRRAHRYLPVSWMNFEHLLHTRRGRRALLTCCSVTFAQNTKTSGQADNGTFLVHGHHRQRYLVWCISL